MTQFVAAVGGLFISISRDSGRMVLLFLEALSWLFRPPWRWRLFFKQMEFIGVNSVFVVALTSLFTGMVLALQTYYAFRMFSAETLVGATVALSMARELGPVITALMVTGRAGSAIAAEIGTMRVTEQVDALSVMAINPVQYLVLPRIIAGVIMVPLLTALSVFIGVFGGYLVGVRLLGIHGGIFMNKIYEFVTLSDLYNGLIKAACFGLVLTLVGCYKGFYTSGGAEGVGRATTQAVVLASVLILTSDYVLTALMM
ncbi:phospholipid/cholesterol/gamma-HCH transport system permease protein [Desulfonatronum thiosulfatophilum]|uniref:Phospholipid/cholesterol/gamma-HCH transport system permease protein n=1 Tax=Desulfonatronum thiosulfatophilum TaxID=617002 RepID=A0A1G6EHE8_9BACT|nr:ABC transporter permease [Desulfonatronum thiosulfatophilum]SDB56841.1 phospholipid/cholesterol/gamma-HCH transport system permease protein [Desulfonatronum thiosulfatophilum]